MHSTERKKEKKEEKDVFIPHVVGSIEKLDFEKKNKNLRCS